MPTARSFAVMSRAMTKDIIRTRTGKITYRDSQRERVCVPIWRLSCRQPNEFFAAASTRPTTASHSVPRRAPHSHAGISLPTFFSPKGLCAHILAGMWQAFPFATCFRQSYAPSCGGADKQQPEDGAAPDLAALADVAAFNCRPGMPGTFQVRTHMLAPDLETPAISCPPQARDAREPFLHSR